MSLYLDSSVLVKLYVREEFSQEVARFVADRAEAVFVNGLHELEVRNALRLKRFREEINDVQLAASLAMMERDQVAGKLIRRRFDWNSVCAEAERLSPATTTSIGVPDDGSAPRRGGVHLGLLRPGFAGSTPTSAGARIGARHGGPLRLSGSFGFGGRRDRPDTRFWPDIALDGSRR